MTDTHDRELLEYAASPEIEARALEIMSRCTRALLSLVAQKAGSLSLVAAAVKLSTTYLYKVQSGGRKISFGLIARLLVATGVSFDSFLRRMIEIEWALKPEREKLSLGRPSELLADWREAGAEKDSPFLAKLDGWLETIEGLELAGSARSPVWRPVVLALEEERLHDWRNLRRRLERLTLHSARKLSRQETVSHIELADLAILLAAWAAVQRVAGLRGFVIDGLTRAFALAERSEDLWTEAFCLQKAAYLGHDLGHDYQALGLIRDAAENLMEVGSPDDLARLAVDRGYFCFYCGQVRKAQRLFEFGLRKLELGQRLYRASAHLALARILRERGDLASARGELEKAIKIHTPVSIEAAYVMWEAAEHEKEAGAFDRAEPYYREALGLFGKFGKASDIAFVSLDYAELLLKSGRMPEMKNLVAEVLGWLAPLAAVKSSLHSPFENLSALLALGSLSLNELDNVRQHCKKAVARLRAEFFVG